VKTRTVERMLLAGRHEEHRATLVFVLPREAFDRVVAPMLSGRWSMRSVEHRRGACEVTVKVFDREGVHASARMLRAAFVALRRAGYAVRVRKPWGTGKYAGQWREGWSIPARLPRRRVTRSRRRRP
jgi:hypothetical protein